MPFRTLRIALVVMRPPVANEGAAPGKNTCVLKYGVRVPSRRQYNVCIKIYEMRVAAGKTVIRYPMRIMAGRAGSARRQVAAVPSPAWGS